MFEGTVRSNMDPLEEYTDEQIWEVDLLFYVIDFTIIEQRQTSRGVTKSLSLKALITATTWELLCTIGFRQIASPESDVVTRLEAYL